MYMKVIFIFCLFCSILFWCTRLCAVSRISCITSITRSWLWCSWNSPLILIWISILGIGVWLRCTDSGLKFVDHILVIITRWYKESVHITIIKPTELLRITMIYLLFNLRFNGFSFFVLSYRSVILCPLGRIISSPTRTIWSCGSIGRGGWSWSSRSWLSWSSTILIIQNMCNTTCTQNSNKFN